MSYVYVLTNDWFPGLTKLGATTNIDERFEKLRAVLPGKSKLNWSKEVDDCFGVEREIRSVLSKFSISGSHDWFSCPANIVIEQFKIHIENQETLSILESLKISNKKEIKTLSDLGEYCKSWRKQTGINQSDFAALCGVGIRFVSEFESGKPTCQFDLCVKVANMLGIDLFAAKR